MAVSHTSRAAHWQHLHCAQPPKEAHNKHPSDFSGFASLDAHGQAAVVRWLQRNGSTVAGTNCAAALIVTTPSDADSSALVIAPPVANASTVSVAGPAPASARKRKRQKDWHVDRQHGYIWRGWAAFGVVEYAPKPAAQHVTLTSVRTLHARAVLTRLQHEVFCGHTAAAMRLLALLLRDFGHLRTPLAQAGIELLRARPSERGRLLRFVRRMARLDPENGPLWMRTAAEALAGSASVPPPPRHDSAASNGRSGGGGGNDPGGRRRFHSGGTGFVEASASGDGDAEWVAHYEARARDYAEAIEVLDLLLSRCDGVGKCGHDGDLHGQIGLLIHAQLHLASRLGQHIRGGATEAVPAPLEPSPADLRPRGLRGEAAHASGAGLTTADSMATEAADNPSRGIAPTAPWHLSPMAFEIDASVWSRTRPAPLQPAEVVVRYRSHRNRLKRMQHDLRRLNWQRHTAPELATYGTSPGASTADEDPPPSPTRLRPEQPAGSCGVVQSDTAVLAAMAVMGDYASAEHMANGEGLDAGGVGGEGDGGGAGDDVGDDGVGGGDDGGGGGGGGGDAALAGVASAAAACPPHATMTMVEGMQCEESSGTDICGRGSCAHAPMAAGSAVAGGAMEDDDDDDDYDQIDAQSTVDEDAGSGDEVVACGGVARGGGMRDGGVVEHGGGCGPRGGSGGRDIGGGTRGSGDAYGGSGDTRGSDEMEGGEGGDSAAAADDDDAADDDAAADADDADADADDNGAMQQMSAEGDGVSEDSEAGEGGHDAYAYGAYGDDDAYDDVDAYGDAEGAGGGTMEIGMDEVLTERSEGRLMQSAEASARGALVPAPAESAARSGLGDQLAETERSVRLQELLIPSRALAHARLACDHLMRAYERRPDSSTYAACLAQTLLLVGALVKLELGAAGIADVAQFATQGAPGSGADSDSDAADSSGRGGGRSETVEAMHFRAAEGALYQLAHTSMAAAAAATESGPSSGTHPSGRPPPGVTPSLAAKEVWLQWLVRHAPTDLPTVARAVVGVLLVDASSEGGFVELCRLVPMLHTTAGDAAADAWDATGAEGAARGGAGGGGSTAGGAAGADAALRFASRSRPGCVPTVDDARSAGSSGLPDFTRDADGARQAAREELPLPLTLRLVAARIEVVPRDARAWSLLGLVLRAMAAERTTRVLAAQWWGAVADWWPEACFETHRAPSRAKLAPPVARSGGPAGKARTAAAVDEQLWAARHHSMEALQIILIDDDSGVFVPLRTHLGVALRALEEAGALLRACGI